MGPKAVHQPKGDGNLCRQAVRIDSKSTSPRLDWFIHRRTARTKRLVGETTLVHHGDKESLCSQGSLTHSAQGKGGNLPPVILLGVTKQLSITTENIS